MRKFPVFSGESRPSDKGGGGGGFHPDPEIRGGEGSQKKFFFRTCGPQFGIKVRGEGWVPLDPPLVLIMTVHDSE